MCGTQSHITLQILTKFTYERFIKKSTCKITGTRKLHFTRVFKDFAPAAAFFRTARPEGVRHSKFQSVTINAAGSMTFNSNITDLTGYCIMAKTSFSFCPLLLCSSSPRDIKFQYEEKKEFLYIWSCKFLSAVSYFQGINSIVGSSHSSRFFS